MAYTVRVEGLRELQRALKKAEGDLDKVMRDELKKMAEPVVAAADARGSRYNQIGPYKPVVTQRAAIVRQSANKVTGLRGDFGALQMRNVLIPVLEEKSGEIEQGFETAMDVLIARAGL